jgi:hypothetical protein
VTRWVRRGSSGGVTKTKRGTCGARNAIEFYSYDCFDRGHAPPSQIPTKNEEFPS